MKFTPVLLLTLLVVQSTVANPQPLFLDLFSDLAQKFGDAAGRVVENSADILKKGVETASDITRGGLELGSGIAKGVVDGATGVVVGGADALNNVSKSIQDGISNTINAFTSPFIRNAASAVQSQVQQVQTRAENVMGAAQLKLNDVREVVEAESQKVIDHLNDFVINQEDKVAQSSDETQQEVIDLLDNFLQESHEKIRQCARSVIAPVQALHDRCVNTIEESFPLLDDVVATIRQCAELNQRDSRSTSACAREIKRKADNLKPLVPAYSELLRQLNRVTPASVSNVQCIASVTNELVREKQSLEARIDQLIREDQ